MKYFYARVSTQDQSLERQIKEFEKYGVNENNLFCDKCTGANFDRPNYKKMKKLIRGGDELIVKELDRLGRDKEKIKEELKYYKDNNITVRILNIPTTLIDFGSQDWIGEMVTNILLEVLSSVSEQERYKIRDRQAEGIAAMKVVDGKRIGKSGRPIGRPYLEVDWDSVKGLPVKEACEKLGISKSTYYRRFGF